ncbi:MAG: 23S rRNA (pseudouridine(1915)-N(3))-methyltransferase RlmH [Bacteriovoracaceae bacterium]|nr:23S rRNA (pseudouridine(1915)-N(3))-methyltransferase RlmH [Bacteriovoracaceae bacterium]
MKTIHIICVGKNKEKHYLSLEEDYLKRIKTFKLLIHEVRSHEEDLNKEAEEVQKKLSGLSKNNQLPFYLLTERGKDFNSLQFSQFIENSLNQVGDFALIIGGASGHGDKLYQNALGELSLGRLTFPHKMARLMLVEQLYRSETIMLGHPYNK